MSASDSMPDAGSSASANTMCIVPERAKLHLAMLVCQLGYAGNHIILKTVLNMDVSMLVFPVYRNIVALVALVPFAYFFEKYAVKLLLHTYEVFRCICHVKFLCLSYSLNLYI